MAARAVPSQERALRNPVDRLAARLPQPWRTIVDWVVTVVGAVAIVLAIKAWVVNPYRIPSSSMEPALHCARPGSGCEAGISDRVLANRLLYHFKEPRRGDVVVFDTPPAAEQACGEGGTFVKRLIVMPGETWEMEDGIVIIDGRRLLEPYIRANRRGLDVQPPRKVPPSHYVMLGDNREHSCDSRSWGPLPRENIIGKVFAVYWPPTRISLR